MSEKNKLSVDQASQEVLTKIKDIETVWERYEKMLPQCKFGSTGICCSNCVMGPCRIIPKRGLLKGICGATAEIITARNLVRMIAAGASAHSDHGRGVARTLLLLGEGKTKDYKIKDKEKLFALAEEYGIETLNKNEVDVALEIAKIAYLEFSQQEGELRFISRAPLKRQKIWKDLGIIPRGIDREVVETMHRTNIGVDNDELNLIKQGFRTSLADGWGGSMIATELSDIMFGSPVPIRAKVNLGVLRPENINIVVHGHEPILSDIIVDAVRDPELVEYAKSLGAKEICLSGICCTANEILMRHGLPIVGNFLQQELAITTGVVDVMLVDVQCVFPELGNLCHCFHTKLISTSPKAKFPFAEHIEFKEEEALDIAKRIVKIAVDNYKNRVEANENTTLKTMDLIAGFSAENVSNILGGKYRSTYRPLNDAIISGRIRGVVGVVGCNNPKQLHDDCHITLVKELIKNDVLVVSTGCSAIANAKAGLLKAAATEFCGKGLKEVCETVGLPPVLHFGSCVDCSRILVTVCNILLEGGLGNDISDLPVAGAAPEWMSEKAVSIGFYVVGSGITTYLGNPLPITGSEKVTKLLCEDLDDIIGAKFVFESDPIKTAKMIIDLLDDKRAKFGLKPVMY